VASSQVTRTIITNSSTTEDSLKRVNALKKHPYNYRMKQRPSSGLIWNQPSRKNILSHNQELCLVQHVLDPMDVPLFISCVHYNVKQSTVSKHCSLVSEKRYF